MPRQFHTYEDVAKWVDEHIGVCIVCLGTVEDLSRTGLCFGCDAKWCAFYNTTPTKQQTSDVLFTWLNTRIATLNGLSCAECSGDIVGTDYLCPECREITEYVQAEDNRSE
jgi:hypothetical protein